MTDAGAHTTAREEQLVKALTRAHADRAATLLELFREIRREFGREAALRVVSAASMNRGREMGRSLRPFAPDDVQGLCRAYLEMPGLLEAFSPDVVRRDDTGFEVKMGSCPLKEAWRSAGVDDQELMDLTQCASAADVGRFEGAGFAVAVETWEPGDPGCCRLHVRAKT